MQHARMILVTFCRSLLLSVWVAGVSLGSAQASDCPEGLLIEYMPPEPGKVSKHREIREIVCQFADKRTMDNLGELTDAPGFSTANIDFRGIPSSEIPNLVAAQATLNSAASVMISITMEDLECDVDRLLEGLTAIRNITSFSIEETGELKLTDAGLIAIGKMSRLKSLRIPPNIVATSDGYKPIGRLKHLDRLYVFDRNFSSEAASHLAGSDLSFLAIVDTSIDDRIWDHLSRLPHLERLILSNKRLKGAGIRKLEHLKHLRHLVLSGTDVDDHALWEVMFLNRLQRLYLGSCKQLGNDAPRLLSELGFLEYLYLVDSSISEKQAIEIKNSLNSTEVIIKDEPF